MKHCMILIGCLLAQLLAPESLAGDELTQLLEKLDQQAATIEDLTARFEQRKHTVLLKEPIVSRGTVRVAGDTMRWDTHAPTASAMLMDEEAMKIHYPDHKVLEIYQLDDQLAQLTASPLPRLAALRKHFAIERGEHEQTITRPHLVLHMRPKSSELAEHLQIVRVVIDLEHAYLLQMEMTDVDEERTVIVLSEHRLNTDLREDALELVVPRGTRVVRPLDDLRGAKVDDPPAEGRP